jgi:hypothetical protein
MKLISYQCDVCREIVREERPGEDARPFVSFQWNIMANHVPPPDRFVIRPATDCERHLCLLCLAGLVAMAEQVLPPSKEGRESVKRTLAR